MRFVRVLVSGYSEPVPVPPRIIPSSHDLSAGVLCAAIVWLPLQHGGAPPGPALVGSLAGLSAFVLAALSPLPKGWWRAAWGTLTAVLLLALLAVAQSVGLPAALVALLSPESLQLARETSGALGLEVADRVPVSLTPSASRLAGLELASLAGTVAAAAMVFRRRLRRRWLLGSILLAALTQIVLGLRPLLAKEVPRLRGSFVNADHLAFFLEVAAALCLATLIWSAVSRRWPRTSDSRIAWLALSAAALLVLLVGIALTGSRAAVLATSFGLLVPTLLQLRRPDLRATLVAGSLASVLAAVLFWIGPDRLFGRLLGTRWYDLVSSPRITVWRESLPLTERFPWFGSGLGGFRESYALIARDSNVAITWAKAHNDYLELWVTGGLVGMAVLFFGGIWTSWTLLAKLTRVKRNEDRLFVLGALGALAAAGVHEFLDFGLTLPANWLLLGVVLGAALGVGRSDRSGGPVRASGRAHELEHYEVVGRR